MAARILLVDDETDLIEVLADALAARLPGFVIQRASSVADAEAAVASLDASGTELALVVSDHRLGDGDGLKFIASLRARHPGLPAILYTGQAGPEVVAAASAAGVRLLWKPIRLATWIAEVRAALEA